jgi:hypothetical protein
MFFYINNTIEKKIQKLLVQKDKMSHLCLNRWIIEDITYYNADWIDEHIELIDKIPENEEM